MLMQKYLRVNKVVYNNEEKMIAYTLSFMTPPPLQILEATRSS